MTGGVQVKLQVLRNSACAHEGVLADGDQQLVCCTVPLRSLLNQAERDTVLV